MRFVLFCTLLIVSSSLLSDLHADEKLQDIACRSVHLGYRKAPEALAFYNEVTVEKSANGTYFCVCGFNKGYFGIQDLGRGKKVVIFSVWDPGEQDDPSKVDEDLRVKLLHQGEGVRIGRFGNEGTGGQSFLDFDWKIGETYRFLVTAKPDGKRTEFAGYFYLPAEKRWLHMVTFSALTEGKPLSGYYSFVEDFRRNRESTKHIRQAKYGNGWVYSTDHAWKPLVHAQFTADSNPATNINAGLVEQVYFLATGGETKNSDTPLRQMIERSAENLTPPTDLPVELKPAS